MDESKENKPKGIDCNAYNESRPKTDHIKPAREVAAMLIKQVSQKMFFAIGMAAIPIVAMLLTPLNMILGFGFAVIGMATGGYFAMKAKQDINYLREQYELD